MLKCVWWEVVFWNQLKNRRTCEEWCVCVSCLVMSNSLQPHRLQPTRPHGILQARTLEWVDTSFSTRNYRKKESEVVQSCPTLYNPMDCSLPGSRIHGIFQERVLEWVAISFSKRNYRKKESEVAQLCPTLCDPKDCSLPGSSIHGIFQAGVLEWVTISFSSILA